MSGGAPCTLSALVAPASSLPREPRSRPLPAGAAAAPHCSARRARGELGFGVISSPFPLANPPPLLIINIAISFPPAPLLSACLGNVDASRVSPDFPPAVPVSMPYFKLAGPGLPSPLQCGCILIRKFRGVWGGWKGGKGQLRNSAGATPHPPIPKTTHTHRSTTSPRQRCNR